MNTTRLQIILNHVDPDIVSTGLVEFRNQILLDHDLNECFGYMGRGETQILCSGSITGVLHSYYMSSPDMEEFFSLWTLPNRNEHKELSASHTAAMAAILYCTRSEHDLTVRLISRIIRDHSKAIHSQLDSSHTPLVHATLSLLQSMCRTSCQACKDVFLKIISTSDHFGNLTKPDGKSIKWESTVKSSHFHETDSRFLVILILFQILSYGDTYLCDQLLSPRSLWKRVISSIHKDVPKTIEYTLNNIVSLYHSPLLSVSIKLNLVDSRFVNKVTDLNKLYFDDDEDIDIVFKIHGSILGDINTLTTGCATNSTSNIIRRAIYSFFDEYCTLLSIASRPDQTSMNPRSNLPVVRSRIMQLLKLLDGHKHIKHREVQLKLLRIQPDLLGFCVNTIPAQWEPRDEPTSLYTCALVHLRHLLDSVAIDSLTRRNMKSLGSTGQSDGDMQAVIDNLIKSMLPTGLTKKEFMKILLHRQSLVQELGLKLLLALQQRIARTMAIVCVKSARLDTILRASITSCLPDFQTLVNLRSRYMKELVVAADIADPNTAINMGLDKEIDENDPKKLDDSSSVTMPHDNGLDDDIQVHIDGMELNIELGGDMVLGIDDVDTGADAMAAALQGLSKVAVEGNNKDDIGGANETSNKKTRTRQLLCLLLTVLKEYVVVAPSAVAESGFDLLHLLDDIVLWDANKLLSDSLQSIKADLLEDGQIDVVIATLELLQSASGSGELRHCSRWMGSKDQCCKLISSLLVSSNWRNSKRSALSKLLLLCMTEANKVQKLAISILRIVFDSSGLFESHGVTDLEMAVEKDAWISVLQDRSDIACLALEICLRMAYHWNSELCGWVATVVRAGQSDAGADNFGKYFDRIIRDGVIATPCSPMLLASLFLDNANMAIIYNELPKNIRINIPPPSSTSCSVITASYILDAPAIHAVADGDETKQNSVQFLSKYLSGFGNELHRLLDGVLLQAVRYLHDRKTFVSILHSLATQAAVPLVEAAFEITPPLHARLELLLTVLDGTLSLTLVNNLNSDANDPIVDIVELFLENQNIPKKKRKMINYADTGKMSALVSSTGLMSLLRALPIALVASRGEVPPSITAGLACCWNLLVDILLKNKGIDYPFLKLMDWIQQQYISECALFSDSGHNESSESFLSLSLNLLHVIAVHGDGLKDAESDSLSRICSLISDRVAQICRALKFDVYFSILHCYRDMMEDILKDNLIGKSALRICVAVASTVHSQLSKIPVNNRFFAGFWNHIAKQLLLADDSLLKVHPDIFRLGWFVQGFVENTSSLRNRIAALILTNVDHYILFTQSTPNDTGTEEAVVKSQHVANDRPKVLALDPMSSFILRCSSPEAIVSALQSYIKGKKQYTDSVQGKMESDFIRVGQAPLELALQSLSFALRRSPCDSTENVEIMKLTSVCHPLVWVAEGLLDMQLVNTTELYRLLSFLGSSANMRSSLMTKQSVKTHIVPVEALYAERLCSYVKFYSTSTNAILSCFQSYRVRRCSSDLQDLLTALGTVNNAFHQHECIKDVNNMLPQPVQHVSVLPRMLDLLEHIHSDESKNLIGLLGRIVVIEMDDASADLSNHLEFTLLEFVPISLLGTSSYIECSDLLYWTDLFCDSLLAVVKHCAKLYQDTGKSSVSDVLEYRERSLALLVQLCGMTSPSAQNGIEMQFDVKQQLVLTEAQKSLVELFQDLTDNLLISLSTVSLMTDLLVTLSCRVQGSMIEGIVDNAELWVPILKCFVDRPALSDILSGVNDKVNGSSGKLLQISVLRLMLVVVSVFLKSRKAKNVSSELKKNKKRVDGQNVIENMLRKIVLDLWVMYSGTMSLSDRLILRICHVLYTAGISPSPVTMRVKPSKPSKDQQKGGGGGRPLPLIGSGEAWICAVVNAPQVYSTLAQFPFWRTTEPSSFAVEDDLSCETSVTALGSASGAADPSVTCGWGNDVMVIDEHANPDESSQSSRSHERLYKDNDQTYDPCFWIPALLYALNGSEISVRQLANCGVLSLVIAALGCQSVVMRTHALACLQLIYTLIKKQTPDVDVAFRERPQLLLLLKFVKDGFPGPDESSDNSIEDCPVLSPLVATFLARAALHLLQYGHELFGKINKYLLSRPFCDPKDAPLYDLLVTEGGNEAEIPERLAVLRLLRDGLLSRECHLNLCRKNAYNRLMLQFPIFAKDIRTGHAILDLLDKALGLRTAARYLLERCSLLTWLEQMAAPILNTIKRRKSSHSHGRDESLEADDGNNELSSKWNVPLTPDPEMAEDPNVNSNSNENEWRNINISNNTLVCPRLLARLIILLRRAVGSLYLLSGDGVNVSLLLSRAASITSAITCNVIELSECEHSEKAGGGVPHEVYRQLILCMWDCSLCGRANGSGIDCIDWSLSQLVHLAKSLHSCRTLPFSERDDMLRSVFCLAAFKVSTKSNSQYVDEETMSSFVSLSSSTLLRSLLPSHGSLTQEVHLLMCPSGYQKIREQFTLATDESTALDPSSLYFSVVHILAQDTRLESRSSRSGAFEGNERLLEGSWLEFSHMLLEKSALPTSLGIRSTAALLLKAIFSVVSTFSGNNSVASTWSMVNIEHARTVLLAHNVFFGSKSEISDKDVSVGTPHQHVQYYSCGVKIARRVLASADEGFITDYNKIFCDFQLLFRLTLLGLLSVIADGALHLNKEIPLELSDVFFTLLCSSTTSSFKDHDHLLSVLLNELMSQGGDAVNGRNLWNVATLRADVFELCHLTMELISTIVTVHDRRGANKLSAVEDEERKPLVPQFLLDLSRRLAGNRLRLQAQLRDAGQLAPAVRSVAIPGNTEGRSIPSVDWIESDSRAGVELWTTVARRDSWRSSLLQERDPPVPVQEQGFAGEQWSQVSAQSMLNDSRIGSKRLWQPMHLSSLKGSSRKRLRLR